MDDDEPPQRRRKPARALRFAEIKVGDQLMVSYVTKYLTTDGTGGWIEASDPLAVWYWIVTDLFFDPVAGEYDELAGRMVAIKRLDRHTGEPMQGKRSHTIRGLASNGYRYADIDFIAHCKAKRAAIASGAAVSIGFGKVLRRRPKLPGERF
jgi:hypothetical protein